MDKRNSMKTQILIILLLVVSTTVRAQQNNCNNIGFEAGDFTNWILEYGNVSADARTRTTIYRTPTRGTLQEGHRIMTRANGNDPNIIVETIPVVPLGSNYSARIGNSLAGAYYDRISTTFLVTPANSLILYRFAIILEDPNHPVYMQPKFTMRILDQNGNLAPGCGSAYEVSASRTGIGFSYQVLGSIAYRNWTTAAIDLRPFLGQTITFAITTNDCTAYAHYGYAYFDAECLSSQITATNICPNAQSLTLSAPLGFEKYRWSTGDTTQSIHFSNAVSDTRYTVRFKPLFSLSDNCELTMDYVVPPFVYLQTKFEKTFCQNSPLILSNEHQGYANNQWSTGATTPTIQVNQAGAYFLYSSNNGCAIRDTFIVSTKPIANTQLTAFSCNPSDTGVRVQRLVGFNGCDSFVYLRKTYAPIKVKIEVLSPTCDVKTGSIRVVKTEGIHPPFSYSLNDSLDFSSNNSFHNLESGNYSLFVKDAQSCVSQLDNLTVNTARCGYFVPNSFSPNGDGNNDVFSIYTQSDAIKTIKRYLIFNRWGNLVYEAPTKNVPFPQFNDWWNGSLGNQNATNPLAPDVFIYLIEVEFWYKNSSQEERIIKGDITLIH